MNRGTLLLTAVALLFATATSSEARSPNRVWRIGALSSNHRPQQVETDAWWGSFLDELSRLGYAAGKNLELEWRFADGHYERLPALAEELVKSHVDLIVTDGTPSTRAAKKATSTIPIVFANASDPVDTSLVASLSRPGGNATGISNLQRDTSVKQLEMLRSLVPDLSRIAVLFNPANPSHTPAIANIRAAATGMRIRMQIVKLAAPDQVEAVFGSMAEEGAQAVIDLPDPMFYELRRQLGEVALARRFPLAAMNSAVTESGGLFSYGQSVSGNYRRIAAYAAKILGGAKPGDLPVEQPTKLELVINRKTAKALGLAIPPELLVLADRVIE